MPEQPEVAPLSPNDHIAVVGMACRFPGANNPQQFWQNLVDGVESVTWLTEDDLTASGVPAQEFRQPHYVNAAFCMEDMEYYDARFFGDTPREAQTRDPQIRWFLETCYAAVQDSGYDPARIQGLVGVVGGMSNNFYGERYVRRNKALGDAVGSMAIGVGSHPDYLATAVSYRLGFQGPSLTVQSACSTSLLAVHTASQLLRSGECDYAVAGGVEIELPDRVGHLWVDGSIYTRTGHIRPFDAKASGTIFGSGVGVVALKRLGDALADGDHVYAVLRGSAVNNDGGNRAGFTAPGVLGQAQLIVEALATAQVGADSIGFVEAHATGTLVGDPIEVAGLTKAFRIAGATEASLCPIGSVKANIGHLGPASGIAGLIKVCLALEHQAIPPNINYDTPNPNLDLASSPFHVVTQLTPWPRGDRPRRAGVSSFGIGGTNVHVVVEEAPPRAPAPPTPVPERRWHVIPLSARSEQAAATAARELGETLGRRTDLDLRDVAFTAHAGRAAFGFRRAVAAADLSEAAAALSAGGSRRQLAAKAVVGRPIAMVFPGQGTQFPGMGRDLYRTEPVFREALDECAALLHGQLDIDLSSLLFPSPEQTEAAADRLRQTRYCQPALFAVEYALARLLHEAGVRPTVMIGHSLGEYVAACLAGVLGLRDALTVVAERGRLMQQMAPGAMLAVDLPAYLLGSTLPPDVAVAAVNSPRASVVSGTVEAIAALRARLETQGTSCAELATSHAFHSASMDPCLDEFESVVRGVRLSPPRIPFVSNVTGRQITDEEAVDPRYWRRQLRSTVHFADGVATLAEDETTLFVEVGPGDAMTRLVRQCREGAGVATVTTMRHRLQSRGDDEVFAEALGALWCHGVEVAWLTRTGAARRVALPTYPFERQRYWAEPDPVTRLDAEVDDEVGWPLPAHRCTFAPYWRDEPLATPAGSVDGAPFLVFDSGHPIVAALIRELRSGGADVTVVHPGNAFSCNGSEFTMRPGSAEDLAAVIDDLPAPPSDIVHAWCLTETVEDPIDPAALDEGLARSFYSLLHLGQQLARRRSDSATRLHVVSTNLQEISGTEPLEPVKAALLGPMMLAAREIPDVTARSIDLDLSGGPAPEQVARQLIGELTVADEHAQVGWRGRKRWRLDYRMVPLDEPPVPVTPQGTYLVTGGLGAIGLTVAEELASAPSTVVLIGRTPVPPREEWQRLVADPATDPGRRRSIDRLLALEGQGCTVETFACDVADEAALAGVVEEVHRRHGAIRGVFHCAGVAGGAMMAVRSDEDAAGVLAPKVHGTMALYRLLGDEVDFIALFSSLTAATGSFGQVDYCAANNVMDSFARWATHHGRSVISIGWTQWTDSGMSADRVDAAPQAFRRLQTGARYEDVDHPLLDRRLVAPGDATVFLTVLEPGRHWIASEHRLQGRDVVVGTGLLEMVDAAYRETVGAVPEIRDVVFIGPIGVTGPTEIQVTLRPDGTGHEVSVTAGPVDGLTRTERLRCRVVAAGAATAPVHDLEAIKARCTLLATTADQLRSTGSLIDHGAHWTGLIRATYAGEREELSSIELGEAYWPECGRHHLHPALLDTAVAEANCAPERRESGDSYLPFSYGRLRSYEPIPARFWVHIRHLAEPGAQIDRMAIRLMHEDGQAIVDIDEYAERRVDPTAIREAVDARPTDPDNEPVAPPTTGDALDDVSVTPQLGRDVLRRILHWRPAPHLLVVPEGIHRNLRRTQSLTIDVVQRELDDLPLTGSAERLVDTEYVPPSTPLQRTIASLWGSALGVPEVGIHDVFFELGGNSLVAVQLASRIRETLDVDLPIAILFDHPTVHELAEFIDGRSNTADTVAP
ncbi:MAG: SDR family NAD(P)-dependent oxidoreductase [Kineosporiaceae bacterium]|nr:SDR family NAD(P)-dependent oxidoreductase [Kineosporiaceae bacterium]